MKITLYIFLLSATVGFSQNIFEGYVLQSNDSPLPYATVRILSNNLYTITNEDGKFRVNISQQPDSIEVTYIGFKTRRVALSYFKDNANLYLEENNNLLEEVIVVASKNDNDVYDLMNVLVKKYRTKKSITQSKAFYTLTSSTGNIPIEQIEGFYNSEQSLAAGIINLKIKSGRFGQNKNFPFYSLDNTKILSDFQFFDKSKQILPLYPGNMSQVAIKKKYSLNIDECSNCGKNEVMVSFSPKRDDGSYFSGNIFIDRERLIIKKIDLWINSPEINELVSINKNVKISTDGIMLEIAFNPLDFEKIQYVNFNFFLTYEYGKSKQIIESRSFLYFYDYNNFFMMPHFTNRIHFNNDYDKIIAMQAMDDFWEANFQFPKSIKEKRFMTFMEKNGFMINFDNTISSEDIQYTKPSVISWNKKRRLKWNSIKHDLSSTNGDNVNPSESTTSGVVKSDNLYQSSSVVNNNRGLNEGNEKLVFNYMLDQYKNIKGEDQYVIKTLFDRNSSYCKNSRTKNKLVYLNIIFDIYEYYANLLTNQLTDKITFDDAKTASKIQFNEASIIVKKMKSETNFGLDYQVLIKWNDYVKLKLNIDNFKTVN